MAKKLNKFAPAKSSKGRFSLIFREANNHNKLEMTAKQLNVDVDRRKQVKMLKKIDKLFHGLKFLFSPTVRLNVETTVL